MLMLLSPSMEANLLTICGMFLCSTHRRNWLVVISSQLGRLTELRISPASKNILSCCAAMDAQFSSDSGVDAPRWRNRYDLRVPQEVVDREIRNVMGQPPAVQRIQNVLCVYDVVA